MFSTLDFVAIIFATGAIIDVWHKGSIFQTARAYTEALQDVTEPESLKGRMLELLNCPFCKSYHIPAYLFLFFLAETWFGVTIVTGIGRAIVYGFAATRLSNLLNGLLPNRLRYIPDFE